MRILRTPRQGYLADHDMIGYWPAWSSVTAWQNETTTLGRLGNDRPFEPAGTGATLPVPNAFFHAFDPQGLVGPGQGRSAFAVANNTQVARSAGPTTNDTGYVTSASAGFSLAFFYKFDFVSAATCTVIERAVGVGGTGATGLLFDLTWLNSQNRFMFRGATDTSGTLLEAFSPVVNDVGWLGLGLKDGQIQFYHSQAAGGKIGATASMPLSTGVCTSGSARWYIGGSIFRTTGGSYNSVPASATAISQGYLTEIGMWRRDLGEARMRSAYAGCVQPWDDNVLLASENYVARTRVFIEDTNGVMQNMSDLDGRDWVREVSREKNVDDATASAQIILHRRLGRLADLSPLNTVTSDYTDMLALRRKVRIERALVPTSWNIVGWEWTPIFEGLIDSWSAQETTVEIVCSDESSALSDAFIMENRAYNYPVTQTAEAVQTQIVDDFEPALQRLANSPVVVGYKGFGANNPPRVYTEAGTATTPTFMDSRLMMRYNDVGSGGVLAAIQAVSDQIGYATEFKYHEPWADYRLTMHSPRRTKQILHETIRQVGPQEVMVEFREPHGLAEHLTLNINGTGIGSLNAGYSASSIMDFYRVVARINSGATINGGTGASIGSAGTVTFGYNYMLPGEALLDLTPAKSDISRIRNHAVVRFNRNESTATIALSFVEVLSGILNVGPATALPNLDPSGNGISFTLAGGTSSATILNGSYSGFIENNTIISDVPGAAPDAYYSTNLPTLSCVHLNYREVASTASTSLADYGYLPVAVYEGSNLAINTYEEATRLAQNLVSDLATPTVEFSFTSKVRPFEVHDLVRLPADALKGRWSSSLAAAITGITERYASGRCEGEYRVRTDQPSRGTQWAERIIVTPARPAPPSNNMIDIPDQASRWNLGEAVRNARRFNFGRRTPNRREMGLRHDQTAVWISTASGFIPNDDNRAGVFRGERFAIDNDGQGRTLSPGTRYYVRFGEMDIFGNVSAISGLGVASTATVPNFVPRFVDETASVVAANATGATFTFAVGDWTNVTNLDIDDGSDDAGITQDNYSLYGTAGLLFQMPCDGTVSMQHVSSWFGDPLKVGASDLWYMLAGWVHIRGLATLGFYGENGVEGTGFTDLYKLTASAQVTCSSGDYFQLHWKNASAATKDTIFAGGSTATTNYGLVSYAVVHQT
jgi:hypothetical protein